MIHYRMSLVLFASIACASLPGCADKRIDRNDDEAMMIYRECMSGPPPAINSADMSMTISNSASANPNTSIAANTQTRQEESQQIRCMQLAGWEE